MTDNQEFKTPFDNWTYERIKQLLVPGDEEFDDEFQFPVHDLKQVPLVRQTNDITPQTLSVGRHIKPQEVITISRDLEKSMSSIAGLPSNDSRPQ
jgi:hypothetical protein